MNKYLKELLKLAKLTAPILIAQLTMMLMGVVDTLMSGRVGPTDLAAVALGSQIWIPITLFIFGISMGLAPVISYFDGEKNYKKVSTELYQNLYATIIIAFLSVALLVFIPSLLAHMELETDFEVMTLKYLKFIVWSTPGMLLYMVLRNFCEGLSDTLPSLWIGLLGLAVNIPSNYIFIYGKFGVTAYGGAGAGIASAIVYTAMGLALAIYVLMNKKYKPLNLLSGNKAPKSKNIIYFMKLGLPISLSLLFEVGLFAVIALFIASMGTVILSGHQIALNISSIIYMVPLSISMALTLRVGHSLGEQKHHQVRVCFMTALFAGLVFASINAFILFNLGSYFSHFYTNDAEVIALATILLKLAAIFTFSDTFQALSMGGLRGLKDTKYAMFVTFLAYWPIGLFIGYILGKTNIFVTKMGPAGFWVGIIFGLSFAAVILTYRFLKLSKKNL